MYVDSNTDTERPLAIEKVLEDIPGGGVIEPDDFPSTQTEFKEGSLVGVDGNGIYHSTKTAIIVAGGSASAPRIGITHELVVGDFLSDGVVSLEITVITDNSTYHTLTFSTGSLSIFSEDTVLYTAAAADTDGSGVASSSQVQDTAGDYLTCTVPIGFKPGDFNGLFMTIEQAADDVLAVAFNIGVLTISLADTTAANNNLAPIQAAVRALGTVEGVDWSGVVFTGTDWDDKQTGATLTTPTTVFALGVNSGTIAPKYPPVGITMNTVNLEAANTGSAILVRGTVNESLMTYAVNTYLKSLLPLIRFI